MSNIKSLLFDNKTIKQTILKNTFWIAFAILVSKFLRMLLLIYAVRVLEIIDYGKFNFSLAFVSLFVIFFDFGLSSIVTRELSGEKEQEKDFSAVFTLRLFLVVGSLVLCLIASLFISPDFLTQKIIFIIAAYFCFDYLSEILFSFFRARQRLELEAAARIIGSLFLFIFGIFVLLKFPSIENFSLAYLFSAIVSFIFLVSFFYFKIYKLSFVFDKDIFRRFLSMSWPLAMLSLFGGIYTSIDSVMMGYWEQIAEVGWYNAAYRIIGAIILPVGFFHNGFFPVLSDAYKKSKENFKKIWDFYFKMMLFLAVPVVVGGWVLASKIIDFLYSGDFVPVIDSFKILIFMGGFIFINSAFSSVLIVCRQQKKNFWIALVGAVTNLILNIILIPKFSLYGASIATVITYIIMFSLFVFIAVSFTPITFINSKNLVFILGVILSTILMYFILINLISLNIFILFIIGLMSYTVVFWTWYKITNLISERI